MVICDVMEEVTVDSIILPGTLSNEIGGYKLHLSVASSFLCMGITLAVFHMAGTMLRLDVSFSEANTRDCGCNCVNIISAPIEIKWQKFMG